MPQTHKLALLDDYQKVAMRMADWDRLKKRGVEITVFHEPFSSVDDAAAKLAPFDMLGLLRERTAFPRARCKCHGGDGTVLGERWCRGQVCIKQRCNTARGLLHPTPGGNLPLHKPWEP